MLRLLSSISIVGLTAGSTCVLGSSQMPARTARAAIQMDQLPQHQSSVTDELKRTQHIIRDIYGLTQLQLQVDAVALQKQMQAKTSAAAGIQLSTAVQKALNTVLTDSRTPEAPLAIAAVSWAASHELDLMAALRPERRKDVRHYLWEALQDERTSFGLYLGETVEGLIYPPEQGEDLLDKWIFVLRIPKLSDHIYWVLVDRKGEAQPYVYGFN